MKCLAIILLFHLLLLGLGYELKNTYTIARNGTEFLLIVYFDKVIRLLPDPETVQVFNMNPNDVEMYSTIKNNFTDFKIGSPVPSLKITQGRTPDERMRNQIQSIIAIEPAIFWKDAYFMPNHMNPTMIKWFGKYLFGWRWDIEHNIIKFGWTNSFPPNHSLDSPSNKFKTFDIDPNLIHLDISPNDSCKIIVSDFNYNQEDPRFLLMSDNSLVISYSVYIGSRPNGRFKQSFVRIHGNETGVAVGFEHSFLLDHSDNGPDQKNWVPFEYKGRLLFLQSIYPIHVVEVINGYNDTSQGNVGVIETVAKGDRVDDGYLPWKGYYGMPIRGGTPAILVRGVYLSFFHTILMFQFPYKIRTYLIGAFTFCPEPPFSLHSMSERPIVIPEFYEGAWVNIKLDYVVFPVGLMLADDGEHLWLSLGTQDRDGWVVKINIEQLFQRLTIFNDSCSSISTTASNTSSWNSTSSSGSSSKRRMKYQQRLRHK